MGCGCKGDTNDVVKEKKEKLGFKIIPKIGSAIMLSILFVILSPFIFILIWWLAIANIFDVRVNIIKLLLLRFGDKAEDEEDLDPEDLDPEEYELMDVEIVK